MATETKIIIKIYECAITANIWTEDYRTMSFIFSTSHYTNNLDAMTLHLKIHMLWLFSLLFKTLTHSHFSWIGCMKLKLFAKRLFFSNGTIFLINQSVSINVNMHDRWIEHKALYCHRTEYSEVWNTTTSKATCFCCRTGKDTKSMLHGHEYL